jgi:DNA ligase (NAD+)
MMLFLVTEKLDGISVSLKYEDGFMIRALSRGNGSEGENITSNVRRMRDVPLNIPGFTGHVRGEIVIRKSNAEHFPGAKSLRSVASGTAKRFDGKNCENLSVIAYQTDKPFDTEKELFDWLGSVGFKTPWYEVSTIAGVIETWERYMEKTRATLDYVIDGLVVKVNSITDQLSLGILNKRPKGAIAFKFDALEATTTLTDLPWQVGDTGRVTPVAIVDTVEIGGVNVSRATLHNATIVNKLKLWIGCKVVLTRRGDVIPYLEKNMEPRDNCLTAPECCPECNSKLVMTGKYLNCLNKQCPPRIIGRLNKWVGELNILEWGEKVLTKLVEAGLVKDVGDLYRLTAEDITGCDRMGEKSATNLISELDKFREISLENFLGGLTIPNVATSTVKQVIDVGYKTLDEFYGLTPERVSHIPGFGQIRAQALCQGLIENRDRINDILAAGVKIRAKIVGNLTGKKFVFTGASSLPRKELVKMVLDKGGEVKDSVSKGVDFLVLADSNSTSSKALAAKKLGTQILGESEFMDMVK